MRDWVDNEIPKDYANRLEQQEYEFPHELWDKFTEAGFHAIGIDEKYGGQGGDIISQMILCRELARSLAGLTWVCGHLFVLRGQVGRALRLGAAEAGDPPPTRQGRDQVCDRVHGACGRHRPARRDDDDRGPPRRRMGHQRPEDLVHGGPRCRLPAATGPHRASHHEEERGDNRVPGACETGRRDDAPRSRRSGCARSGRARCGWTTRGCRTGWFSANPGTGSNRASEP